jgi:hypothetical protein
MPYHIGDKGSYGCKGFPVVKDSDNEVMGCHATKEDAKKQLAALYVNEPEASKEKAMAMDYATSYAEIVKYDKNEDGTLMVYGKATDDTLDLDSQICDPKWLDEAMPRWFKSGGNIREMHGPSAAGIAKEYEAKNDGHYIGVHVVDPLAAKKVETGVYQGFSIGIKSPRVVRDAKAANGRIIDGSIIEVSLVDRPANPSAKLILAKSVEGETSLVQVEELHDYTAPLPSEIAKAIKTTKGSKMETIKQITELAKSLTTVDSVKFDKDAFDKARVALAELIATEAAEMGEGHDERHSLSALVGAVHALMEWYEGEAREGEIEEVVEMVSDKAADMPDCANGDCGKCDKCMAAKNMEQDEETETEEASKSADAEEAPIAEEATVEETIAAIEEATQAVEEAIEVAEEVSEAIETSESTSIEDVVEKAVKSAMESVKSEIDALRADKEAAVEKSVKLESDLATALSKSVAGGPKRTATNMSDEAKNDALVKAASYKAKADATTDPVLAKGYRALYAEFIAKANPKSEN